LDLLKDAGFNLIASSNNHAFDLGTEGILYQIQQLELRNMAYAGIGVNVQQALRPAWLDTDEAMVGVVSAPTLYRYGGIATDTQAGVNAMQLDNNTFTPLEDQHEANRDALARAAAETNHLISYHHNHYFEPVPGGTDEMIISDWWRNWAHETIEVGAAVYVSHGSTLLHGVEIYQDKLIMYGLGSCFFQTRKGNTAYEDKVWESVIAEVCLRQNGAVKKVKFIPVVLNAEGTQGVSSKKDYATATPDGQLWFQTRGIPHVARNERGVEILHRLAELSDAVVVVNEAQVEAYVDIQASNNKTPKPKRRPKVTNDDSGENHVQEQE
jgi:poly-gamma-glutamate synthesis protein (capsule biosynthesis protein)